MASGALAGLVLDERAGKRPRLELLGTIDGFDLCVLTRARHGGLLDPLVDEALGLERTTMRGLGDSLDAIEFDIAETVGCSTFALLVGHPPARPHRPELVGAVRFMLGGADGVKTLWDVDRRSARLRGPRHPWLADPAQLADAMAFSPAPDTGLDARAITDLLMAACTCVGGALLHSGRSSYLTAYVHRRFDRHVTRLGYPLCPFVPDDHAANEPDFLPVVASLETIDHLVRTAPAGTHFGAIRPEYLRIAAGAATLGTADW